ncbi:ABC transporter permease [Micrococcus terreus]|uniref:Peptide/nickel transport system permease protein n=1 Tax=Micrococcus terreus TaxID=574650 RepID=A0A1I7MEJ8_9MICC|nr:ABC transporter permease [Micrococcus terreus]SFV20363.1 peptide/nickel transport system permease protein [Micrococcus terreus]
MLKFILRRLGSSLLVLFGASVLLYVLVINSGDPLKDLRESNADNREYLMQQRAENMNLDMPWFERYWTWLKGVGGCFVGDCDLGTNRSGQQVVDLLALAASSTLRLVVLATLIAIVVGVAIGILTAIRQYSGMDYVVTFFTFLFFSLPVFWAAVLLKEYMAIGYNNWIADPSFSWSAIIAVALVLGITLQAVLGGTWKRRLLTFAASVAFVCVVMPYLDWLNFARYPQLGPIAIALVGAATAVGATALGAGLRNRRVLYAGLITVAVGVIAYYATYGILWEPTWWILAGLFVLSIAVAIGIGHAVGGFSKGAASWVSVITALVMGALMVVEQLFRSWPGFLELKNRPISTIGSQTPNFVGTFWEDFLDKGAQLLLPTILLTLISLASYSRYTRASMLEVNQQDYIRTARAKGLGERQVILKHAFRNSLIPITTIMAFDFAGLIGGAVITERVFGWKGMGELFATGLDQVDPAPVMAFFLVTGTAAVLFNLLADILYAVLDPRIRV